MATTKGVLKGCGIGCLAVFLIGLATVIGCGVKFTRGFNDADSSRKELEAVYGLPSEYVPAADGAIAPERMKAFLAVREALMVDCEKFSEMEAQIARMDAMDEDASKTEVFKTLSETFGSMFGHIEQTGDFLNIRNTTLMDQGMGLGEYTYLFVLGYYAFLEKETRDEEGRVVANHLSSRVRNDLRAMFDAQLAAAEAAEVDVAWLAALGAECEALRDDIARIPWANGPPPVVAASFEPFRDDLERMWCVHTAPIDLQIIEKKAGGLSYHGH